MGKKDFVENKDMMRSIIQQAQKDFFKKGGKVDVLLPQPGEMSDTVSMPWTNLEQMILSGKYAD